MKKKNLRAGKTVKSSESLAPSEAPPTEPEKPAANPAAPPQTSKAIHVPPILLEGDEAPQPQGPQQTEKYSVGPAQTDAIQPRQTESRELPDSYGTGQLLLAARDPHWLYAHWDLSREQQRSYNTRSLHGHLIVRVRPEQATAQQANEIHLHPESRHWFLEVRKPGTAYIAELGYYQSTGEWASIATSGPASTPTDQVSQDKSLEFASTKAGPKTVDMAKESEAQTTGIIPPRVEWIPALDTPSAHPLATALEGPGQTIARSLSATAGSPGISSLEIAESIRREIEREISFAQFGSQSPSQPIEAISSPMGGMPPQLKAFWFNVNAELVIYGATQPDALVTIGGQPIQLRPDGTFTCRFALPDGQFELELAATSVENDSRRAQLKFGRSSRYDDAQASVE
jgi:hypothetical protein